jgi:multiple sugar transport system substrate-binding protein
MKVAQFKNVLLLVAVSGILMYLTLDVSKDVGDIPEDAVILQFWHPWTGEYADALIQVVAEFNRTHPKIHVKPLFMPTGAGESMKFFSAVAGGVPPDIIVVDGTQVASWADMGVLRPLDARLEQAGITAEDFWEPSWKQCRYNGKTWALSAAADPNFALVWNKHQFRQAGLDPERPPRTIAELEEYAYKLTVRDENGRIERLGFLPTYVPHASIAVLTWGWAFGGDFYNDETQEFTCDLPENAEAMQWIRDMQEAYGGQKRILSFESSFGFSSQNPFYLGKLSMNIAYVSMIQEMAKFAPNIEYGIGRMPIREGAGQTSEWIGGWTMAIPYGHRGHDDEAFEFMRWLCAGDEGATYMAQTMTLLPAYRKSRFFTEDVPGNKPMEVFYEILNEAEHTRPITPANARYMTELMRALGRVRNGSMSAGEALKDARKETEKEWAKIQTRTKAIHTLRETPVESKDASPNPQP